MQCAITEPQTESYEALKTWDENISYLLQEWFNTVSTVVIF